MLNHITIMGRLTREPEVRYTQSQVPVASFTVAVDRDFQSRDGGERQTDFINCVAWRSTAEFVSRYFTKGSMILVDGRIQVRNYSDNNGQRRTFTEVVADNVYFAASKRESGGAPGYGQPNNYGAPSAPSMGGGYGGGEPKWVDWYFRENFNGECLSFGYAQAGQENSFSWPRMKDGLTYQFEQLEKLQNEGKITVEPLGETGRWYQKTYSETPASAISR